MELDPLVQDQLQRNRCYDLVWRGNNDCYVWECPAKYIAKANLVLDDSALAPSGIEPYTVHILNIFSHAALISALMDDQNNVSLAFRMEFSTPRWEGWMFSTIRGHSTLGIRTLLPLKITPSIVISSGLKFHHAAKLKGSSDFFIRPAMHNIRYKMRKDYILGGDSFDQFKSVIHDSFRLLIGCFESCHEHF